MKAMVPAAHVHANMSCSTCSFTLKKVDCVGLDTLLNVREQFVGSLCQIIEHFPNLLAISEYHAKASMILLPTSIHIFFYRLRGEITYSCCNNSRSGYKETMAPTLSRCTCWIHWTCPSEFNKRKCIVPNDDVVIDVTTMTMPFL